MVTQAARREDLDENQNQGAGSISNNMTTKTKAVIIDFLSEKKNRKSILSDENGIRAEVLTHIITDDNPDYKKSLLKGIFGDVIDINKLKGEKISEKTLLELLSIDGIPEYIKTVLDNIIKEKVSGEIKKLIEIEEGKLETITDEKIKEKEGELETELKARGIKDTKVKKLRKEVDDMKNSKNTAKQNGLNYTKLTKHINENGIDYSNCNSIKEAFEGSIPKALDKKLFAPIAKGFENIQVTFEDVLNTLDGSNEDYKNFQNGVETQYILDKKYNNFNNILLGLTYAKLENDKDILNKSITALGGKELLEKNKLSVEHYFRNELILFIGEKGQNATSDTKFYDNFYTFLGKTDKRKASIFKRIKDKDSTPLNLEEKSSLMRDIKPMLKAYKEKIFEDPKLQNQDLDYLIDNLEIPTTKWKITKDGEEKIVNISVDIEIGLGDGCNAFANFAESTFNLNIEIDKNDMINYPTEKKDRVHINVGNQKITVDEKRMNEFDLYNQQEVAIVVDDGANGIVIDCRIIGENFGELEVVVLDPDKEKRNSIEFSNIIAIYRKDIHKGIKTIKDDLLGQEKENELENSLPISERFRILKNVWENDIPGEGSFEEGAILHFALGQSEALEGEDFGHLYVKCIIDSINRDGELILKFSSNESDEGEITKSFDIKHYCSSKEDNLFTRMKTNYGGEFFTMDQGIESKDEFKKYLANNNKIKGTQNLKIPGELKKYVKDDKLDDIAYIGRVGKKNIKIKEKGVEIDKVINSPLFFKTTFTKNGVKLIATSGGFEEDMTYDEFLIFMADKSLKPFTKKEQVDTEKTAENKGSSKMTFYSLENIFYLFKMPTEELKTKWKRRDERLGSELYGNLIGSEVAKKAFGWIPYMNEVSQEADAHASHKIKQLIGEYEKHFEENFSHDAIAANTILEEILKNEKTALSANKKIHYKALAAYKFASKKDHPYFRGLKKQAGSGLWVLALLGPNLYEEYKKEFSILQKDILNDPSNIDLINEYTQFEMTFIKANIDGTRRYPGGTGPGLEGVRDTVGGSGMIQEGLDDMNKKSNFFTKRHSKESLLGNHRLGKLVGAKRGVVSAVYNNETYKEVYKDLLFFSMSGLLNVGVTKPQKLNFEQTVKSIGFTPGYYATENGLRGGEKMVDFIDLVTRKLMNGVSFKKELQFDFHKLNFSKGYHEENMKLQKRLDVFWKEHGTKLMNILNMKNIGNGGNEKDGKKINDIFSLLGDVEGEEKKLVEDYLYKKSIDHSKNYGENVVNESLDNENIYWSENVMNYPKWVSSKLFSTTQNGLFKDCEGKDITETLWINIIRQFDSLSIKVRNMNRKEKDNVRKWGVDKVLQLLGGGSGIPSDLINIIKARSYPKKERSEYFEKIKGKKLDLKPDNKALNNEDDLNGFILKDAIAKSVYEEKWKYPESLTSGVKSLLNFLEELRKD